MAIYICSKLNREEESKVIVTKSRKNSKKIKRSLFPVDVWIQAETTPDLADVTEVIYILPGGFKDRFQKSVDIESGFKITVWTYTEFELDLAFVRNGNIDAAEGFVSWVWAINQPDMEYKEIKVENQVNGYNPKRSKSHIFKNSTAYPNFTGTRGEVSNNT